MKKFLGYKYDSWFLENQDHKEAKLCILLVVSRFRNKTAFYFRLFKSKTCWLALFVHLFLWGPFVFLWGPVPFVDLTIILVPFLGNNGSGGLPHNTIGIVMVNYHFWKGESDKSSSFIWSHLTFTSKLLYSSATVYFIQSRNCKRIPQIVSEISSINSLNNG